MTAPELLGKLTSAGCRLIPDGEDLVVRDPRCVLTEEVRQAIREHKIALLAMLAPLPPRHVGGLAITDAEHPCRLCGGVEWRQHVTYRRCNVCGREDGPGAQGKS